MNRFMPARKGWQSIVALMAVSFLLAACSGGHHAPPPTPVITAQPSDASVVAGSAASFSVTTTGSSPSYQWQSSADGGTSWASIVGATSTSYILATTMLSDSGRLFRVLVTAAGATVASSPAQLTVTSTVQAPAISVQPANQTVTEPATATFSVTASGTSLQYQWQLSSDSGTSWTDISAATAANYTTPATVASATGAQLRVQINNSAGSVTSNAAVLTINVASANAAPVITAQPASQSVAVGSSATFSASVSGTPTPTLQWQRSNNNGGSWTDIASATNDNYSTSTTTAGDNGAQFRIKASNSQGSATSDAATLTVTVGNAAPVFTTQPQDVSVREGNDATFSAAASGVPSPTYQWQVSNNSGSTWDNMNGATADTYTQPGNLNTCSTIGKRFRVIASNSEGTVNSNAAALNVNPPATGWQCDFKVGSGYGGDAIGFSVASNASGQVAVVWPGRVNSDVALYIRRYDPASGWGAVSSVVLPDSGSAAYMSTGMDNQGTVTAAWVASDIAHGGWNHVWAVRNTAASGWGAVAMQPLPDYTTDGPGNGQPLSGGLLGLAVNPAGGNATVLWTQDQLSGQLTGKRNLIAASFGAGGWGNLNIVYAQNSSGDQTYMPGDLRVATGANGHAVAVWHRLSESSSSLWAIHFTAGAVSGSTVQIADIAINTDFYTVALAVDGSGRAILAWQDFDSSVSVQRVRLSRYDGGWATPRWMSADGNDVTRGPAVAFAPNGSAVVGASVYAQNAPSLNYRVVALSYTTSGGWGAALEPVFNTGSNIRPSLAAVLDNNGVAMIAAIDGSSRLKSSRRISGTWNTPEIATKSGSAYQIGQLLRLPSGDVLAAYGGYGYLDSGESGYLLWSNTYKPAP